MKVLLVFTENYARGGGNIYLIDLVNAVACYFDTVRLVCNAGALYSEDLQRLKCPATVQSLSFVTKALLANRVKRAPRILRRLFLILLTPFEPLFFGLNLFLFRRLLARFKPSCVLSCNGGYPAAQASLAMVVASRRSGISAFLSIVSMPRLRRPWLLLYDWLLDRSVWRSARAVIVNAKAILNALQQMRGMPPEKCWVVHNGIEDVASHGPVMKSSQSTVVGCVARMDREKGVLQLVDAFAVIARKYPSVELILAGEGNASKELADLIRFHHLENRVKHLGQYQENVNKLLLTLDIYAFPSLWEGFPYSILEALRAGCAIVATNVGGIPEAIENGKEGLLVTPGSTEELILAIDRLLADKDLRFFLAYNGRLRYEREFSLETMDTRVKQFILANMPPEAYRTLPAVHCTEGETGSDNLG